MSIDLKVSFTVEGAEKIAEQLRGVAAQFSENSARANSVRTSGAEALLAKEKELASVAGRATREAEKKAQAARASAESAVREAQAVRASGGVVPGGLKGGNVKIEGLGKLRLSSEVFSGAIRAAGVILASASIAMQESANKYVQAAGKIASFSGMGWGVGQAFGRKGGTIGAVFGAAYGLTSEISKPFFEKWEGTDEESRKKTARLREASLKRRQNAYSDEKFAQDLEGLETADAAKSLVDELTEQLEETRLKIKHALDGTKTQAEARGVVEKLEQRLSAAKDRATQLAKAEDSQAFSVATEAAESRLRESREAREYETADLDGKIKIVSERLVAATRTLAEAQTAAKSAIGTDAFSDKNNAYEKAAQEHLRLSNLKADLDDMKAQEPPKPVEEQAQKAQAPVSGVAMPQADALSRVGGFIGEMSSAQMAPARATERNTAKLVSLANDIRSVIRTRSSTTTATAVYA